LTQLADTGEDKKMSPYRPASCGHTDLLPAKADERQPEAARFSALAIAATALGACAVGAIAIGALAVGRLAIGRTRIHRMEIDELLVHKLRVVEELRTPPRAEAND